MTQKRKAEMTSLRKASAPILNALSDLIENGTATDIEDLASLLGQDDAAAQFAPEPSGPTATPRIGTNPVEDQRKE